MYYLPILLLILALTLDSSLSHAEVFRWPKACAQQKISITNKSAKEQTLWLQQWERHLTEEQGLRLPARSQTDIMLNHDLANPLQSYSLLLLNANATQFNIQSQCEQNTFMNADSLEGGILEFQLFALADYDVQLKNLSPQLNHIQIEELDSQKKILSKTQVAVAAREMTTLKLKSKNRPRTLKISAQQRFHSSVSVSLPMANTPKYIQPQKIEIQSSTISEDEKYFLMAPYDNVGDQFIIKIKDPLMIEKARVQISKPELQKIVFARIQLGHQGYNRNLLKKEKSFWSWSVAEVTNIADFGSTACNGFPQMVEDQVEAWINNSGRICFWSYRIKKELSAEEVMNPHK